MSDLYITQYSIGFISPALLSLIISGAIIIRQLKTKKITPDRTSLALYFFGASIYNILNFFGFSIYSEDAQIIWYIESFAPFAVLFIIRFAYYYPTIWREKERKIVLITGSILSTAAILEYWINSWNSPVMLFGHTFGAAYHSSIIPLLIAFFYLWTATVFLRRAIDHEKNKTTEVTHLKNILIPSTKNAKTARTFSGLIMLDIIHSVIVYGVMNKIPISAFNISFYTTLMVLIIYSLYTYVYLHSAYDNIPFVYKLTGIPVIIILILITASGYMMTQFRSISYDEMNRVIINQLRLDDIRNYKPDQFPFSYIAIANDKKWEIIYDKYQNMPYTFNSKLWDEAPNGIQLKTGQGLEYFSQIKSDKKYFIKINNINYSQYNHRINGKIYGFGIPYLDYLKYMHQTGILILTAIIISMLLIITLLPMLYYFGIINPLRQIINRNSTESERLTFMENEFNSIEKILKNKSNVIKARLLPEKPEQITSAVRQKLDKIKFFLEENFRDDISREGLGSMIDLDPDYISRLFKIYTGSKIGDYINKLRIEEATRLLVSSDKSIIHIAMLVGYESLRTFNRTFIKITSQTPTSFRNKNQQTTGQKL